MKISYDYSDLMDELMADVKDGMLKPDDNIFIIREKYAIANDYHPIVDWYYLEDLSTQAIDENDKLRAVKKSVNDVLIEMIDWNTIV